MSRRLRPRYLEVWLHGQHSGWLCEADGVTRFVATEHFLTTRQRPTLSLSMTVPLSESITQRILGNHFDPAVYSERGELPPYFAGLLPEGPLRRRLAATRQNGRDQDSFGILAAAGEDLPGAIRVIPADRAKLTRTALAYGVTGGTDDQEIDTPESAAPGAASVAGAQDKLALSHATTGNRYVLPQRGHLSNVIAKLPSCCDDSLVMNEYACMRLASLAGASVAECHPSPMRALVDAPGLIEEFGAETRFLAVERFDRGINGPVHVEDGCQFLTLRPNQKYAGREKFIILLRLLTQLSGRGIEDVRQMFIRQVTNALLGNADAHLKNIGFIYRDGISPELAPAYDIVCVTALPEFPGWKANVALDQQLRTETLHTYAALAKEAGISERVAKAAVKQTVSRAKDLWPSALRDMEVPATVEAEILRRLATIPLALGA